MVVVFACVLFAAGALVAIGAAMVSVPVGLMVAGGLLAVWAFATFGGGGDS